MFPLQRHKVLVSAHRGGVGRTPEVENTCIAFERAVLTECEYVEFDIQRTRDGVFLLNHDSHVLTRDGVRPIGDLTAAEVDRYAGERVRLDWLLDLLAKHDKKAHLDFKFASPPDAEPSESWEVEAVRLVRKFLRDDEYVVTTNHDHSVRLVRDWADSEQVVLLAGLSLGRHRLDGMGLLAQARFRWREAFPRERIENSRANLIVAQRHLARWRLLTWAHRTGLPVLVWTVDNPRELRRLMRDRRVWMVTSNFPERALHARRTLLREWLCERRTDHPTREGE